jgi:hypothetical protein
MTYQIYVPRRGYYKPVVYAEIPGQKQYAGRRIGVSLPADPRAFDPAEHVRDLGPRQPGDNYLILPGMGAVDQEELADLAAAIREKNAKREASGEGRDRLGRNADRFNQRFRDHIDQVLRARVGRKTFGPGSNPTR